VVGGRFYRSIESVHRYFRVVLRGVLRLYKHLIRKPDNSMPPKIRNSQNLGFNHGLDKESCDKPLITHGSIN
jgi:hypothetical protein